MSSPHPTIKQLEAFAWTAKLGSFQAAALHLCTTQSAIAKRVAELESLFSCSLLDRNGRKPRLTTHGKSILEKANDVLAANGRLVSVLSEASAFQGHIKIGVTQLVSLTWLARLVDRICVEHPSASIELVVDCSSNLKQALEDGLIDVGLLSGAVFNREFDSILVGSEVFAWLSSPVLALPDNVIPFDALSKLRVLEHSANGISTPNINRQLSGTVGRNSVTADSISAVIQMVLIGLGVSFLPVTYLSKQLKEGRLVKVKTDSIVQDLEFYAVFRKELPHPLSHSVIEIAKQVIDFRNPDDHPQMRAAAA